VTGGRTDRQTDTGLQLVLRLHIASRDRNEVMHGPMGTILSLNFSENSWIYKPQMAFDWAISHWFFFRQRHRSTRSLWIPVPHFPPLHLPYCQNLRVETATFWMLAWVTLKLKQCHTDTPTRSQVVFCISFVNRWWALSLQPRQRSSRVGPHDARSSGILLLLWLQLGPNIFSGFLFWGCHGQVGSTRFQVGMTGADQRRYLRPDE